MGEDIWDYMGKGNAITLLSPIIVVQVELNQGFTFLLGEDWRSKSVQITVDDSSQGQFHISKFCFKT